MISVIAYLRCKILLKCFFSVEYILLTYKLNIIEFLYQKL